MSDVAPSSPPRRRPTREQVRKVGAELVANPGYKLLSLGIAIGAWLYVQSGQLSEAKVRADLEWRLPEDLVTTEPLPSSILVTVAGSRSATRRAQRAQVQAVADLSNADVGEVNFDFATLSLEGLPPTVSVISFSPSSARLALDTRSSRKVKVKPVIVGDPQEGYQVLSATVDPPVVEVRGARSVVTDIGALDTKPIDASNLTGDVEMPVELELPWGIEVAGGSWIRAKIDVEPVVETQVFENVPVVVWGHTDGSWKPTPSAVQVTLRGPSATLRDLSNDKMMAVVHLPDNLTRSSYEAAFGPQEGLRLSLLKPAGDDVKTVSVKPPVVEVVRP